jgi:aspartate aminotransferase
VEVKSVPKVSSRGLALPPSPIRKLSPYADAAKARGVKVFHLNIGQPDLETPKVMRDRLKSIDPVIAYSPSAGTPQYLAAMCRYYATVGLHIEPANVVATTGGSEALFFAFLCLAEAGDEVIVAEPFYTNYNSFAAMAGVRLVPVQSRGEEGFHLPPREAYEAALTPRTRFVLLCNPNNPTGTVYSREEVLRVATFCRDHDLFLVSDEVYREFVYDGLIATSALDLEGFEDRVVVVDSLSKRFSACGIRLGCFVSRNAELIATVTRAAQGRLSPPGLAQVLALGMSEIGEDYHQGGCGPNTRSVATSCRKSSRSSPVSSSASPRALFMWWRACQSATATTSPASCSRIFHSKAPPSWWPRPPVSTPLPASE